MKSTALLMMLMFGITANLQEVRGQMTLKEIEQERKSFLDLQKPLFQPKEMHEQANIDFKDFVLQIKSSKRKYLPGELITLSIEAINISDRPRFISRYTVKTGFVEVFIINSIGEQKKYSGTDWGLFNGGYVDEIPPGGSLKTEASILYNEFRPSEPPKPQSLPEGYVFSQPGKYLIKVVRTNNAFDDSTQRLESSPLSIEIIQPTGNNLQAWNRIKNDPLYGYVIQNKTPIDYNEVSKNEQRIAVLEELLDIYPDSTYADQIRQSLPLYNSHLEKAKKLKEATLESPYKE